MAINRAQGCWLGQLTGDALGSLVEFQSPGEIRRLYPEGVRYLADGGTWGTIAGQPPGYLWGSLSPGNCGGEVRVPGFGVSYGGDLNYPVGVLTYYPTHLLNP